VTVIDPKTEEKRNLIDQAYRAWSGLATGEIGVEVAGGEERFVLHGLTLVGEPTVDVDLWQQTGPRHERPVGRRGTGEERAAPDIQIHERKSSLGISRMTRGLLTTTAIVASSIALPSASSLQPKVHDA
jgi:hypothetical protein